MFEVLPRRQQTDWTEKISWLTLLLLLFMFGVAGKGGKIAPLLKLGQRGSMRVCVGERVMLRVDERERARVFEHCCIRLSRDRVSECVCVCARVCILL